MHPAICSPAAKTHQIPSYYRPTMTGVTAASRSKAWNIWIYDCPPSKCLAGAYQAVEDPFLTWKDLFDDLLLCFNLEPYMTGPPLALYLLQSEDVFAHNLDTPMIYYNSNLPGSEKILSQIIKLTPLVGSEGPNRPPTCLPVAVINHDFTHCKESDTELASHLKSGCAKAVTLKRNLNVKFLPIPSGRPSKLGTPQSPTSPSPAKRSRRSEASINLTIEPSLQLTVPPELETNVKELFSGTCVITGFDSSWGGTMVAGPGIETCHIFPKALYNWWGYPNSSFSTQEKWNIVNSSDNCMTMEAFSHSIHDNRLLAIHPVSHKIRLFAPIKPLEGRNNKLAYFPRFILVDNCFLKWHYEQTIIENMCALFLWREGGAKRTSWRGGPSSVMATDEEGQFEVGGGPPAVFPDSTYPTAGGASMARGVDGAAQENMDSESINGPESDNERPLSQKILRKRPRSSSADSEIYNEDEFTANLYIRLDQEARYQESLEDYTVWSKSRAGLTCL